MVFFFAGASAPFPFQCVFDVCVCVYYGTEYTELDSCLLGKIVVVVGAAAVIAFSVFCFVLLFACVRARVRSLAHNHKFLICAVAILLFSFEFIFAFILLSGCFFLLLFGACMWFFSFRGFRASLLFCLLFRSFRKIYTHRHIHNVRMLWIHSQFCHLSDALNSYTHMHTHTHWLYWNRLFINWPLQLSHTGFLHLQNRNIQIHWHTVKKIKQSNLTLRSKTSTTDIFFSFPLVHTAKNNTHTNIKSYLMGSNCEIHISAFELNSLRIQFHPYSLRVWNFDFNSKQCARIRCTQFKSA